MELLGYLLYYPSLHIVTSNLYLLIL